MTQFIHRVYISILVLTNVVAFVWLGFYGSDYYTSSLEVRHFHSQNEVLKPSGLIGHGLGVIGSSLMIIGVFGYMARKRIRSLSRIGTLKYWLEFHIFLCSLGPVLVLYHTSFKFGGLVAISFWSMIAVVLSGVIGRFIYIQIPRTIEGREMSLNEINKIKSGLFSKIESKVVVDTELISFLNEALEVKLADSKGNFFSQIVPQLRHEKNLLKQISLKLRADNISGKDYKFVMKLVKREIILNRRIAWLSTMQNFLRYWHVAHLPFALIMLVIMIIHVIVAVVFGYKWIF